jgi:hypothetical protein
VWNLIQINMQTAIAKDKELKLHQQTQQAEQQQQQQQLQKTSPRARYRQSTQKAKTSHWVGTSDIGEFDFMNAMECRRPHWHPFGADGRSRVRRALRSGPPPPQKRRRATCMRRAPRALMTRGRLCLYLPSWNRIRYDVSHFLDKVA